MKTFAIFDLDGTLLDTIQDLANACNYALTKNGFPVHPVEPYKIFVGNGVYNLMTRALPEGKDNEETILKVKADFDEYYAEHATDVTAPYPGIQEMLRELKSAGVKLAVLSNKPDAYTGELVRGFFPGVFDVILGQREGVPIKPDPAPVYEIMKLLGVKAGEGVYIGDTSTDMKTGKAAGLFTVGVTWGFRTKQELVESGADVIIDKAHELCDLTLDKS
jgi:phosphoglycolate phosphatase